MATGTVIIKKIFEKKGYENVVISKSGNTWKSSIYDPFERSQTLVILNSTLKDSISTAKRYNEVTSFYEVKDKKLCPHCKCHVIMEAFTERETGDFKFRCTWCHKEHVVMTAKEQETAAEERMNEAIHDSGLANDMLKVLQKNNY